MRAPFVTAAGALAVLTVVTTLGAGSAPAAELPAGGHVFVLGVNGTLAARDPDSLKTAAQGPESGALAVAGNRKRLFGMEPGLGRVFEINTKTMAATPIVELKQPQSGICANPDGSRLLLVSSAKKTLHIVDTVSKQAVLIPADGPFMRGCQFTADGSHAYVLPSKADEVLIIDIKTSKTAGKVSGTEVYVHPNPARKLALLSGASRISYVDTVTHKASGAETIFAAPIHSVAFHPDGTRYYALSHDKVFVVELQSRVIQKTLELLNGALFRDLAIDSQGKRLYIGGNHEIESGVGALLNKWGKEFLALDLETGKKTYQAFPPVQAVQFLVTP